MEFPESLDPALIGKGGYEGKFKLTDPFTSDFKNLGQALLSPTRSFGPFFAKLWAEMDRSEVAGIIHNTGGGHSKVLKFIQNVEIEKKVLWPLPEIFKLIQKEAAISEEELFKTFNCGIRMELYVPEKRVETILQIASELAIDAYVLGEVKDGKNELSLSADDRKWKYSHLP
jgi:phosphoribosylformylglycinamidine cyclo-ligase